MGMIDGHGRNIDYLRLAVTDRCNLRCTYCMPEGYGHFLPKSSLLSYEELERLLSIASEMGVKKVRLTGGEPFVRKDLISFIERICKKNLFDEFHLTTNGVLTTPYIPRLVDAGVSGVNLSLDTLSAAQFREITRRNDFEKVMECLYALLETNIQVKINTVVMQHVNTSALHELAGLTKDHDLEVRFIEEMPFNGTGEVRDHWNYERILLHLSEKYTLDPTGYEKNGTSMRYKTKGHRGEIGIIAAYSRTFCGTCNRLRIGPTGKIKTCLYGNDHEGLFPLLRTQASDAAVKAFLSDIVSKKPADGFASEEEMLATEKKHSSMVSIGG